MTMYEYVLRQEGLPDEVLISDYNTLVIGDTIAIRNRTWRVLSFEVPENPRAEKTLILVPAEPGV